MTPALPRAPRLPRTHPLPTVALPDAMATQFRLLEHVAAHFEGPELFAPDAGVVPGLGRPRATARTEAVLADFFGTGDTGGTRGTGGTGDRGDGRGRGDGGDGGDGGNTGNTGDTEGTGADGADGADGKGTVGDAGTVKDTGAVLSGRPDAALVQGAGTGAIRAALTAVLRPGEPLLVHRAPPYRTTAVTLRGLAAQVTAVDFNDPGELRAALASGRFRWAFVQHSRQRLTDSYDLRHVLAACRAAGVRTVVDDNYAVLRTPACGVQLGADVSCFSLFKLHGPEGVGAVVGARDVVARVREDNYSGGGQVQGHQALDVLRGLTQVPVLWAVQSAVVTETARRLAAGEVPGVAEAVIANAQDRCVLVRLHAPVAHALPETAARFGAAPYPVGSASRYEIAPLFYRMSRSALEDAPQLADVTVRINPMRAGADLVLSVLHRALTALDADRTPGTDVPPGTHSTPGADDTGVPPGTDSTLRTHGTHGTHVAPGMHGTLGTGGPPGAGGSHGAGGEGC